MSRNEIPESQHAIEEIIHGFQILSITPLQDCKALAYEMEHLKTGAKVLHLHCNDPENLFSIGFKTPPANSTGIAHILEHSVLAGSKKYPVKDAFNELSNRTMNTFLNAMTWPDRTVYPVASTIQQDYFNLASVYADLVFHPLLHKKTLEQEGHHYELEKQEDGTEKLQIKGIVYNEMKGVYSSPESLVYREIQQSLLPDTIYANDSGGDPNEIPSLTYSQFLSFHQQYYSPSNSRIFLYGNISLLENLRFLEEVLEPFDSVEVNSEIPLQKYWDSPREICKEYAIGEEDSLDNKTFVVLSWLLNPTSEIVENLLLEIAIHSIVGTSAGPLHKALLDSNLGQDLFPSGGFDNDIQQSIAHFGLRGTNAENAEQIEAIVFETLRQIIADGISSDLIEATLHQIEFSGKEITSSYPVMLLMRANPSWYFGTDPKPGLQFSNWIESVRKTYQNNPRVFEELLQKWFLDNPHRLKVIFSPSQTLTGEQDKAFQNKMESVQKQLSEQELEDIRENQANLLALQNEPPTEESLATLPQLQLKDVPKTVQNIAIDEESLGGVSINKIPMFSNGLIYFSCSFDLSGLSEEELQLLPFLGQSLTGLGAGNLDYQELTVQINQNTGGLQSNTLVGRHLENQKVQQQFTLDAKFLPRKKDAFFQILKQIILHSRVDEHERIRSLLQSSQSQIQSQLIPKGHLFALYKAASTLDITHHTRELWQGVSQFLFLKNTFQRVKDSIEPFALQLKQLQKKLFVSNRLQIFVGADPQDLKSLDPLISSFVESIPTVKKMDAEPTQTELSKQNYGIVIPAEVNYVAQVLPLVTISDPRSAALEMLSEILSNEWMYQKIRVQGGAYGGFSSYMSDSGLLAFLSYRDPQLLETFDVYSQVVQFVEEGGITDSSIQGSHLGTLSGFHKPLSPAQQVSTARYRRLLGLSDETRQRYYDSLLHINKEQVISVAQEMLEKGIQSSTKSVLSSKKKLDEANLALENTFQLVFTN